MGRILFRVGSEVPEVQDDLLYYGYVSGDRPRGVLVPNKKEYSTKGRGPGFIYVDEPYTI